eukprot:TRINITY_DN6791_c0_g2_i1.p1 TRINITY_DN6791_c0_g2~~TRINITY_DN6791_c0_g2_i1.p1  ORF type:complete len:314 (+),score=82.18 TRINITY_DN6791_c0_g2_i1:85-1026(+)
MEGPVNVGLFTLHTENTPNCIFEKLGGQKRLEHFVDGFYDLMATDKDMAKFFAARNLPHLKKRTVDFLGGLWGGAMYRGPDLFLAHTGLGISLKTFDLMMKCSEKHLKKMKVDKQTSERILKDFKGMRDPLCDPSGKLAKAQNEKNLAGGDPFDDAANRAAYAENQRKLEERRAKMREFKKKRLEEEAAEKAKKAAEEAAKKSKEAASNTKMETVKEAGSEGKKKREAGKQSGKKDDGKKKDMAVVTEETSPGDKCTLQLPPKKVETDASTTFESTTAVSELKQDPATPRIYFDCPEATLPELQPGQRVVICM